MYKNLAKIGRSEDMIADRQTHTETDRQADTLITILRSPIGAEQQERVCVQHSTAAVNMTLLAFAAERRAAAPLLLGARRCRSICPARAPPSSKPAASCCSGRQMGHTDGHRTVT